MYRSKKFTSNLPPLGERTPCRVQRCKMQCKMQIIQCVKTIVGEYDLNTSLTINNKGGREFIYSRLALRMDWRLGGVFWSMSDKAILVEPKGVRLY